MRLLNDEERKAMVRIVVKFAVLVLLVCIIIVLWTELVA